MIPIAEGSTGHSYKSLFGKYLDETIQEVSIEEPYIREHYQVKHFKKSAINF